MAVTYSQIATQTLGSATADVTFSSIPGTYTDLVLVSNYGLSANADSRFYINADTGTNYSMTNIRGDGTNTASSRNSSVGYFIWGLQNATVPTTLTSTAIYHFQNYANTTTYKTVIGGAGDAGALVIRRVGLWRSTSAITEIKMSGISANFLSGSTFSLYGIKAA